MLKKTIPLLISVSFIVLFFANTFAQVQNTPQQTITEYPFTIPSTITATLNVETQETEMFNNKLIGYNIFGFTKTEEKEFIRKFNPITIRFPHGVWANFYNWETDGYTDYGDTYDHEAHDVTLANYEKYNIRAGFPGLTALNNEKKLQNGGAGYDMIWTYNLNYDTNLKSTLRLQNSDAKGFDVKDIEIGNEHFWTNQRGTLTSTPQKYVTLAKSLSDTLKKVKPDVRVSIPLSWRTTHGGYNSILVDNKNYFDAITVHKYAGADPDVPAEGDNAYSTILTARLTMEKDVNYARSFAPGKPVWLTEWGVSAGDHCQAAAALGMADCYLYLFENQDKYERANWFSVNGVLNSFITISNTRVIKYPLEKTGYGTVYEIIRSVFENSTMLKGTMTTTQLTTSVGSTNAVNARAVTKDGKTMVFAVNLTNKPVVFNLNFNGKALNSSFLHQAFTFNDLSEELVMGIDENPLHEVNDISGKIVLPPYSVNKISDFEIPNPTHTIPGIVELENYNYGGQGVSYFDTEPEDKLGEGRTGDGVDVGLDNSSKVIGFTRPGEWINYDVDVVQTGDYKIEIVYSSGTDGAKIGLMLDSTPLLNNHALPQTNGWTSYKTDTLAADVHLSAGRHTLKLTIENAGSNLDKIIFKNSTLTPDAYAYYPYYNAGVQSPFEISTEHSDEDLAGVRRASYVMLASHFDQTIMGDTASYNSDNGATFTSGQTATYIPANDSGRIVSETTELTNGAKWDGGINDCFAVMGQELTYTLLFSHPNDYKLYFRQRGGGNGVTYKATIYNMSNMLTPLKTFNIDGAGISGSSTVGDLSSNNSAEFVALASGSSADKNNSSFWLKTTDTLTIETSGYYVIKIKHWADYRTNFGGFTILKVPVNSYPQISILSPIQPGTAVVVNQSIKLTASASPSQGKNITKVEFFEDGWKSIGEATPEGNDYVINWSPTSTGGKYISAKVTDSSPQTATSSVIHIQAVSSLAYVSRSSYTSLVEFEDYDFGGGASAFVDLTSTAPGAIAGYRTDYTDALPNGTITGYNVQLGTGGTGINVAYTAVGEKLNYTIPDVPAGNKILIVNYASIKNTEIKVTLNGLDLGNMYLTSTGNWGEYHDGYVGYLTVAEDANTADDVIAFEFLSGGCNLDYFSFAVATASPNSYPADINVYPNPSEGTFLLSSGTNQISKYHVLTLTGKQIVSGQFTGQTSIQISLSGVYILQTTTGENTHTQKIIVR